METTDRHKAYTALLERHHTMLWNLCMRRANGDPDRCKDLLQEVSIALWLKFDKLRTHASPQQERAWVRWQARSVFYQLQRRPSLPMVPLDDTVAEPTDHLSPHPQELLEELMTNLSPDERRLLQLHLDGYHGKEIGEMMNIKSNTIYQRMRRAVQKMRIMALILLVLLIGASTAIALVPEWRQYFFGDNDKKTVADTIPASMPPALESPDTVRQTTVELKAPSSRHDTLEKIAPLEITDILCSSKQPDHLDSLHKLHFQKEPTVWVNGRWLIVSGAQGEQIRVWDYRGKLVVSEMASNYCIIQLPHFVDIVLRPFTIQIGNRPSKVMIF